MSSEVQTQKLTFDDVVMKLTQEYNPEDFKRYEATLLVKTNPTPNVDVDDSIDFDKLFMKIDKYYNDEKFEMKGFVGSIADISPSFVEKFAERYASFIDQDVIKNDKELKSPYYSEMDFADDLTAITNDDSRKFKDIIGETVKFEDNIQQTKSMFVYQAYTKLIDLYNNTILAECVLKFREHIGKIEDFKSKVTTPFFYAQPVYSAEFRQEELDGICMSRREYEMVIKYIEATYKQGCDVDAIFKAIDQRIKRVG